MKNILYTIILSLLFSFSVFADFEVGLEAYKQGDYATALKEFKNLAKQGDAAGQVGLGTMYHDGKGVTQDYEEAAKWFRLAADQGYARAQYNLGYMYQKGLGVTFNPVISLMWINIAAINKYEKAKETLSYIISEMTSIETGKNIAHANKLAHQCIKNNYKDCS